MLKLLRDRSLLALLCFAVLSGCGSTSRDRNLEVDAYKTLPIEQADAGYASASVVSIMTLAQAKTILSTTFELSADKALKEVQNYSRTQARATLDAASLGIQVGLSQRNSASTQTHADSSGSVSSLNNTVIQASTATASVPVISSTTSSTDTANTTTSKVDAGNRTVTDSITTTISRVQGNANSVSFVTSPLPSLTMPTDLTTASYVNPALARQAADQLLKLIQSMSKQMDTIPHNSETEDVFIVQIKTTLQPYKPLLPLDAFVTVSVYPDFDEHGYDHSPSLQLLAFGSEEYEFSSASAIDNYFRGLNIGFSASAPGGAVNAGLERTLASLMRTYATDVNGLINAASLSPNTVQLRLGALWQGSVDRAMIPRAYNGFFALIVPKKHKSREISLLSKPIFRNPATGRSLQGTNPQEIITDIRNEFCSFKLVLRKSCVYQNPRQTKNSAESPISTVSLNDDWFDFMHRIRRNDLTVLACVAPRREKDKTNLEIDGEPNNTCSNKKDLAMVEDTDAQWAERMGKEKRLPAFALVKFASEIDRVGLKMRSSYGRVILPAAQR